MKLEKRSSGEAELPQEERAPGKKPVIVYIMILFVMAFFLMTISFLMHQRSNSETLGQLQSSVSAMQEIQATQDKLLELQTALEESESVQSDLESQLEEAHQETEQAQRRIAALTALYTLQQQYSAGDLDACRLTLQSMTDLGQPDLLPTEPIGEVTSPSQRYLQLKDAVLNS